MPASHYEAAIWLQSYKKILIQRHLQLSIIFKIWIALKQNRHLLEE